MAHAITREDGRYFNLSGWTAQPRGALAFRSAQDAAAHIEANKLPGKLTVTALPEEVPPGMDAGFDPFGLRRN